MMTGSGTSSADGSLSGTSMLLPLVLGLLEKLLAENSAATSTPAASGTAAKTPAAAATAYTGATTPSAPAGTTTTSSSTPSGRPVGGVITQIFHPGHTGIDLAVPIGTNVKATMSGKVIYAGWNDQGYGNLVIVENGPYRTYFAHLSQVPVKLGQEVTAGSVVGISGSTGNSTGPHVHYEVRYKLKPVDPAPFMSGNGSA